MIMFITSPYKKRFIMKVFHLAPTILMFALIVQIINFEPNPLVSQPGFTQQKHSLPPLHFGLLDNIRLSATMKGVTKVAGYKHRWSTRAKKLSHCYNNFDVCPRSYRISIFS